MINSVRLRHSIVVRHAILLCLNPYQPSRAGYLSSDTSCCSCFRTPEAFQEEKEMLEKIQEAQKARDNLFELAEEWKRSVTH
eukprot:1179653-Prorocentrum_minimum.AAC.3